MARFLYKLVWVNRRQREGVLYGKQLTRLEMQRRMWQVILPRDVWESALYRVETIRRQTHDETTIQARSGDATAATPAALAP